MSLRVLLADESASIRKVFQMGLQDYGADVKSVQNGLDVVEVAESYQPDIIFADILLQKKNGYEVCQEINDHSDLSLTPVILMWSSFMELDQGKYKSSGAKGELEKPFDVEKMRQLIKDFVETSRSQQLSNFLTFPKSITSEFVEEEQAKNQSDTEAMPTPVAGVPETEPASFDFEEDDGEALALDDEAPSPTAQDLEATSEFNLKAEDSDAFNMFEVPPTPIHSSRESTVTTSQEENWEAKPLNINQLKKETETEQDLDQFQSMDLGHDKKLNLDDFLYKPTSHNAEAPTPTETTETTAATGEIRNINVPNYENTRPSAQTIGAEEMEAVIRAETRQVLSRVIKEQLPTILEKVVREELEKVMQQELALKSAGQSPG